VSTPDVDAAAVVLEIGLRSVAGSRSENQDRVGHFESSFGHVFVLADGMGGHRDGALAATLVVSSLPEVLRALPESLTAEAALVESIQRLNDIVHSQDRSEEADASMGSTVALLLVRQTADGFLAIGAHVGDSRIYFQRHERLFCLTRDDTVVQAMVDAGELTPDEASVHPRAGVLTAALGQAPVVEATLTPWRLLEAGDRLLLCSDGISGYLADGAIGEALGGPASAQVAVERLIERALAENSADNLSAVVIAVGSV
jgi:PPM family protein phosphatase